jgi:cytochrome c-type biogenesis protein CcmH
VNILFWLIIAALVLLALGLLILPIWRQKTELSVSHSQDNIAIARQRLAELKQQLVDAEISQSQYDQYYLELQQSLNDDLSSASDMPAQQGKGRWVIWLLLLLVPAVSVPLYLNLGDTLALEKAQLQQNATEIHDKIPGLIAHLQQNPSDLQGWLMLGKSYVFLQDYPKAAQVFAKLYQLQPENLEVILNYADNLAMSRDGQLAGEPAALIEKALTLEPNNNEALWLAGMAKMELGDYQQALNYWQKLANQLPADAEGLGQVQAMIAEATAQANTPKTEIAVKVTLDATLKAEANQTLFVYAQAVTGPKMPLAIVRKQVSDLPLSINLNDSMAMQPNLHLADFKQLKIIARISKTGDASTQKGDLIGSTEISLPISQPVSITINQSVD